MAYRILSGWYDKNNNDITLLFRNSKSDKKLKKKLTGRYPYIYLKKKDVDFVKGKPYVKELIDDIEDFVKVVLWKVTDVYELRRELKEQDIEPYEADIPFVRRIMIDEDIKVGDYSSKKLFFDLETDDTQLGIVPGRDRILSVGCYNEKGEPKYITNKSEKKLLEEFLKYIEEYDTLVSWNGDWFDYPVLQERCKVCGIWTNWKQWQKVDFLTVYKKSRQQQLPSYSLDNVGEFELNLKKIERREKIIELYKHDPEKLMVYNLRDSEIMWRLEKKLKLIELQEYMATFGNVFIGEVSPTVILDTLVFMKVKRENLPYRFKCKGEYGAKKEKLFGGYVRPTIPGLHNNVIVMDFKSIYNYIIDMGLSPELYSKYMILFKDVMKVDLIDRFTDYLKWVKENGYKPLLPDIQRELMQTDEKFKNLILTAKTEEEKHYAKMNRLPVKFLLKSYYGQIGSSYSRHYISDAANTITGTCRWLVKSVGEYVEKMSHAVIYQDTDSVGIRLNNVALNIELSELLIIGEQLNKELNLYINKLIFERLGVEKHGIRMKFEKVYKQIIFTGDEREVNGKKEMVGAKKRYVDHCIWEEGNIVDEINWTGLEQQRSEWSKGAKQLQKVVVEKIFAGETIEQLKEFVLNERQRIVDGKAHKEELILSKSISQPIDEYKISSPHVRVAQQMDNVWVGLKIQYIIIEGGECHIDNYKEGDYDRTFYWNKQIYPPAFRILRSVYPNSDWKAIMLQTKFKITKDQMRLSQWCQENRSEPLKVQSVNATIKEKINLIRGD